MWGLRINESIIDLNISGGAEVEMGDRSSLPTRVADPPLWGDGPSPLVVTDPPLWGDGPSPLVGAHPTSRSGLPKGWGVMGSRTGSWEIRWDSPSCALGQTLGGYGAPLFYGDFNY